MVSKSLNKVTEIGVRLNPNFSGKASKFGVDEDIFYDFLQNKFMPKYKNYWYSCSSKKPRTKCRNSSKLL